MSRYSVMKNTFKKSSCLYIAIVLSAQLGSLCIGRGYFYMEQISDFIKHSKEMQIGKAGEYLACADLIMKGFAAYPSEQGLAYDVVLDTGVKLIRVQVKSTQKPRVVPQMVGRQEAYYFTTKTRGNTNNRRGYGNKDCDIYALVCLDIKSVAYIKVDDLRNTIKLRSEKFRGTYPNEKWQKEHDVIREHKDKLSATEISKKFNITRNTVLRILNGKNKVDEHKSLYFSDYSRDFNWFLNL